MAVLVLGSIGSFVGCFLVIVVLCSVGWVLAMSAIDSAGPIVLILFSIR